MYQITMIFVSQITVSRVSYLVKHVCILGISAVNHLAPTSFQYVNVPCKIPRYLAFLLTQVKSLVLTNNHPQLPLHI